MTGGPVSGACKSIPRIWPSYGTGRALCGRQSKLGNARFWLRIQPVDATHWLNRSPPPSATSIPLRHLRHVGRCTPCLSKFAGHTSPSWSNVVFGAGNCSSRKTGIGPAGAGRWSLVLTGSSRPPSAAADERQLSGNLVTFPGRWAAATILEEHYAHEDLDKALESSSSLNRGMPWFNVHCCYSR